MNSTARSVVVTIFLLGALASSGLVSILTNPAGPIAASERVAAEIGLPNRPPLKTSGVEPIATLPGKPLAVAERPTDSQPISKPRDTSVQQKPISVPAAVGTVPPVAGAPATMGVHLSSDGLLPGRLNLVDPESGLRKPTKNLTISFLQGGKVIAQVKPGVSGVFQVKDLPTGIYSMVASGADGFLAMSVLVLPPLTKPAEALADDDPLQIDVDAVHPVNVPLIRMMIRERLYPSGTAGLPPAKTAAAERLLKERGRPLRTPTVTLDADGSLKTRFNWISSGAAVRTPATDTVAYLIRDGVIASKSDVNTEGVGRFTGMITPGSYALMVVPAPTAITPVKDDESSTRGTRRGYCAMGIMVAPSEAQTAVETSNNRNPIRLVSAVRLQPPANSVDLPDIDLVPIEDIEGSVAGSSDGLGGDAAGLAGGAPPARTPAGGAGGGGGGGSDVTPLLVGGGIAGLLAAGSNLGSSNVSATATSSSSGGGGSGGDGGDGGSPKAIK